MEWLEQQQTICCGQLLLLVAGTQFVASRIHASMRQFNISSHAITCLFIKVGVQVVLNVLDKLDQCHDVFMPDTTKKKLEAYLEPPKTYQQLHSHQGCSRPCHQLHSSKRSDLSPRHDLRTWKPGIFTFDHQ